jgi:uncharacterized protein (DUF4415 family)
VAIVAPLECVYSLYHGDSLRQGSDEPGVWTPRPRGVAYATEANAGATAQIDPDDALELGADFLERAVVYEGAGLVRRGRPKLERHKRQITLRLDAEVVEALRATGPGWQTRANAALAAWLKPLTHES